MYLFTCTVETLHIAVQEQLLRFWPRRDFEYSLEAPEGRTPRGWMSDNGVTVNVPTSTSFPRDADIWRHVPGVLELVNSPPHSLARTSLPVSHVM